MDEQQQPRESEQRASEKTAALKSLRDILEAELKAGKLRKGPDGKIIISQQLRDATIRAQKFYPDGKFPGNAQIAWELIQSSAASTHPAEQIN